MKKTLDRLALKVLNTLLPEAEADSWADLTREKYEGKLRNALGERPDHPTIADPDPPPPGEPDRRPIYRRDGQIHSSLAMPWGGYEPLTSAQYQARYNNRRPVPRYGAANNIKTGK